MRCFVLGGKNGMGCYVRGNKNSIGCYVRGDKNTMGCFVLGGKSLCDILSMVTKNGMGCFVPGCFVRLPGSTLFDFVYILLKGIHTLAISAEYVTSFMIS